MMYLVFFEWEQWVPSRQLTHFINEFEDLAIDDVCKYRTLDITVVLVEAPLRQDILLDEYRDLLALVVGFS